MTNFHALDTLTIYFNISKIRLLIQISLCRNARIQMDISKKNRFSAEKAIIFFFTRTEKINKVPICEMLESTGFFSTPMLPIFSWELKIIAYRGSFTIPSSSKLELLRQCEMTSWYYIVTKSSIVDDLWVEGPPLVCFFFLWETLPKRLKFNQVEIYKFKVKKKSTRTRYEMCPKLTIKAPKRR